MSNLLFLRPAKQDGDIKTKGWGWGWGGGGRGIGINKHAKQSRVLVGPGREGKYSCRVLTMWSAMFKTEQTN